MALSDVVHWTIRDTLQWNLNQNTIVLFKKLDIVFLFVSLLSHIDVHCKYLYKIYSTPFVYFSIFFIKASAVFYLDTVTAYQTAKHASALATLV